MPKSTITSIHRIMSEVKSNGYLEQIDWQNLAKIIRSVAGFSELTVQRYIQYLQQAGFIEKKSAGVFQVLKFE